MRGNEMGEVRSSIDAVIQSRQKKEDIAWPVQPQAGDGKSLRALYDTHQDDETIFSLTNISK